MGVFIFGLVLINVGVLVTTVEFSELQWQQFLFRFDPRHWPFSFSVTLWLLLAWLGIDTLLLAGIRHVPQPVFRAKMVAIRTRFTLINVCYVLIFGLGFLYIPPYRLFYWRVFRGILAWFLIALFVESVFFLCARPVATKAETTPPPFSVWLSRCACLIALFVPVYLLGWHVRYYNKFLYNFYDPYIAGPLTEYILTGKIPWHLSVVPVLALVAIVWLLKIAKNSH